MFDSENYQFAPVEVTVRIEPCRSSSTGRHIYVTQVNGNPAERESAIHHIQDIVHLMEKPIRLAAVEEWKRELARKQEDEQRFLLLQKEAARERLATPIFRIRERNCLVESGSDETLCGEIYDPWAVLPHIKAAGTMATGGAAGDCCECLRNLARIREEAE